MTVKDVINSVDSLCPNDFSIEQKLSWYSSAEALVANVKKELAVAQTRLNAMDSFITLPKGVTFDRLEYVFIDGRRCSKVDFSQEGIWGSENNLAVAPVSKESTLTVVYRKAFSPIKYKTVTCAASLSGATVTLESPHDFKAGERVAITNRGEYAVSEADGYSLTLDCADFDDEEATVTVSTALSDETLCHAPYNEMYVHFIIAKMCYFRHDYEGYNNAFSIFSALYNDYEETIMSHGAVRSQNRVHNLV